MTLAQEVKNFAALRSTINTIEVLTPTNYNVEKQKWLDSGRRFFNPVFEYDKEAIRDSIRKIENLMDLEDLLLVEKSEHFGGAKMIVFESLMRRLEELQYLQLFLKTVESERFVPGDHPAQPLDHLFGKVREADLRLAKLMIERTPVVAFRLEFPGVSRFISDYFRDFEGMFSIEDKEKLKAMNFDAEGIRKYFQIALDYMRGKALFGRKMAAEEAASPLYYIAVDAKYTAVSVNAFSSNGRPVIAIPKDRKVDGLKLLELIGHELNSHYRSAMATRNYFRGLLEPFGEENPFTPLVPMMTHSLNETLSEGLAKTSDVRVSGRAGLPKPYQILAIEFIREGHNFKETMEYVFELSRMNRIKENSALNNAWQYTYRAFRGMTDTSSHIGFAFPKDKVYLAGFTSVLENVASWDEMRLFEPNFMNLLRYSTLTLEELIELDRTEYRIGRNIGADAYAIWKYGKKHYEVPDPVEYVASLLLF